MKEEKMKTKIIEIDLKLKPKCVSVRNKFCMSQRITNNKKHDERIKNPRKSYIRHVVRFVDIEIYHRSLSQIT